MTAKVAGFRAAPLHHLQRYGIDQVARLRRQRGGRTRKFGVAGTQVGGQVIERDVRAAYGAAGATAIRAGARLTRLVNQFAPVSAKSTTSSRSAPLKSGPDGARMIHLRSEKGDLCEPSGR
jgi:hypothetical protein